MKEIVAKSNERDGGRIMIRNNGKRVVMRDGQKKEKRKINERKNKGFSKNLILH